MASFSKVKAAVMRALRWAIFSIGESVHLWVELSQSEDAEQSKWSEATKFSAERESPSNAGLDS